MLTTGSDRWIALPASWSAIRKHFADTPIIVLILDTHIWVWWVTQQWARIPSPALQRMQTGTSLAISASSVYELSVLARRQRIVLTLPLEDWLDQAIKEAGITVLSVTDAIARCAGQLEM